MTRPKIVAVALVVALLALAGGLATGDASAASARTCRSPLGYSLGVPTFATAIAVDCVTALRVVANDCNYPHLCSRTVDGTRWTYLHRGTAAGESVSAKARGGRRARWFISADG